MGIPGDILRILIVIFVTLTLHSCQESSTHSSDSNASSHRSEQAGDNLFTHITPSQSGIDFRNQLTETESSNYYQYMYSYIGGGVAAADFNNDGWVDLFFISNTEANKLYLNQGNLKFTDITQAAGIEKRLGFDAGVSVADVNNDGWLDIYIARGGGNDEDDRFANMLYINNGPSSDTNSQPQGITFTEKAKEHGLADANRSIHSSFFDYDKDGDLDLYISNTPDFQERGSEVLDLIAARTDPKTLALKGIDKLYNNDGNGQFTDVSIQAGIHPDIGFGLNPQVGDLNNDGWLDIYVCNDFRIPDFAYLNNQDGTFREGRNELVKHMSFNSMGSDIADVNNDGLTDLLTLDMNPADYVRSKTTMAMTSIDMFETMVEKDYHYNYMHNMLQINNGNGTYSEISKMAGVADTDWSWACLLADFDLDGYNDVFITNGVFRDVIDRDANNQILQILRENKRKPTQEDFLKFAQMLPQQKLTNFFFRNKGDLTFENVSSIWTDSVPTFSNGAVYADLDNDGDLDIVVSNLNDAATVLQNNAVQRSAGNYLVVNLSGPDKNKRGVGAIATLHLADGSIQTRQLINSRGFLSSVSHTLHFGLAKSDSISSLTITWPDGKIQQITSVSPNQSISIDYQDQQEGGPPIEAAPAGTPLFTAVSSDYQHTDPHFNDYEKQILLPHKLSQTGPGFAKADVNGDGLEDVFIGGGHTQAGQLLIARKSGKFSPQATPAFDKDRQKEDVGACFFDADNDGDMDLYVVSGSYEFSGNSKLLIDRLYLNDGTGNFSKKAGLIPEIASSGSVVVPADFDRDGDMDLFVGGRVIPGQYPFPPGSFLLVNESGQFTEASSRLAPALANTGMVTDAAWSDIDQDEDLDLIITGEWMGIEVWENTDGHLAPSAAYPNLSAATGWWNALYLADVDQDGDSDIVAGNLGLNYKFHASADKPFHVYTHDFDFNGTVDVFLAKEYKGTEVPVRGKTCASQQVPHLAQKIPSYQDFASRDLEGILGPSLQAALHYQVVEFRSGIFLNEGNGRFTFTPFSNAVQQSPVNSILYEDFDGDAIPDLLMAGNNHMSEVETTRADAGIGSFLKGNKNGAFTLVPYQESGFFANKDVRNMIRANQWVFVLNNNDTHDMFKVHQAPIN